MNVNRVCERTECSAVFTVKVPSDPKRFCCRSCSTTVNNIRYPKRMKTETLVTKRKTKIEKWLEGTWAGGSSRCVSDIVRNYMIAQANYACTSCGFNKPHPSDGKSILEVDHIDGNGENHRPENLRVLCPNCHTLTPTFRGRNRGKGRKVFYTRVSRT